MADSHPLLETPRLGSVIMNEAENGQDDLKQVVVAFITASTTCVYCRRRATRKRSALFAALEGD
jgi:hypothetical protein